MTRSRNDRISVPPVGLGVAPKHGSQALEMEKKS
jgi:hypothetical protein